MSTIQIFANAAGQAGKVTRTEGLQASVTPSGKPVARDQDMMYAWSIGVTEAVHEIEHGTHEHEECPPEVYIG